MYFTFAEKMTENNRALVRKWYKIVIKHDTFSDYYVLTQPSENANLILRSQGSQQPGSKENTAVSG